jgi:F-type H+-transporting ATPase subunit epsilon
MHKAYTFKIVTPNGTAYEADNVSFSKLPGAMGEVGVIPSHSASLIQLTEGEWMVRTEDGEQWGFIKSGVAHVLPEEVLILAPFVEKSDDIDVARVKAAVDRAKARLIDKDPDVNKERARLALLRSEIRLNVSEKV